MANKKVVVTVSTPSLWQNLSKEQKRLEAELVKIGVLAYGPDYNQIVNSPVFKQGSSYAFTGKTPRGMKAEIAELYERAWRERYSEIVALYTPHASEKHRKWKQRHMGHRPYDDGKYQIYYETPGKMTGHLEASVAKAMLLLKDTDHIKFANLSVAGGFAFNPDAYPPRREERKDGSVYVDNMSYVIRFIDTLVATGVLQRDENLVDFSQQRWIQIAQAMSKYARRSWVAKVADFFEGWGITL